MTNDYILAGLIDQCWLARETYFARRRQELLPSKQGLTPAAQRELTTTADAAWDKAETALWRHRATH